MCNPVGIQWLKYATYMKMFRIDHRIRKKFDGARKRVLKPSYQAKFKIAAMKLLKLSYLHQ